MLQIYEIFLTYPNKKKEKYTLITQNHGVAPVILRYKCVFSLLNHNLLAVQYIHTLASLCSLYAATLQIINLVGLGIS